MLGLVNNDNEFKYIKIQKLYPTFVVEVDGVDCSKDISEDVFAEILAASAKLRGRLGSVVHVHIPTVRGHCVPLDCYDRLATCEFLTSLRRP
jgi:hypothetical protein